MKTEENIEILEGLYSIHKVDLHLYKTEKYSN